MDWLTLTLAIYGAVLSTALGINELQRNRRKIKTILEYIGFEEYAQLRVVNVGTRAVNIIDYGLDIHIKKNGDTHEHWEAISSVHLRDHPSGTIAMPQVIEDGHEIIIRINENVSHTLLANGMKARVYIYDADQRVHTKMETKFINPRYGRHTPRGTSRSRFWDSVLSTFPFSIINTVRTKYGRKNK